MDTYSPIRRLSYSAVLIAVAVTLGYSLAWIPNVELISFTAAFSGYLLGASLGAFVGAMSFMIYSFISPFGMPSLILWLAQGTGGAFCGLCGAIFANRLGKFYFAALAGFLGTLFYDAITNAAGYFAFPTEETFIIYIIGGIGFAIVHILSNIIGFAVLFPIIVKRFGAFRMNLRESTDRHEDEYK